MKRFFTQLKKSVSSQLATAGTIKTIFSLIFLITLVTFSEEAKAQLGVYEFTGSGACPTQNPSVTTQPANAVFSNFTTANATCNVTANQSSHSNWNEITPIDLNEYHEFSITANTGYALSLTSLSFTHSVSENGSGSGSGNTRWILRSSVNNYTTNITTGSVNENTQTPVIALPAGSFSGITAVTFRLYITEIKEDETTWTIDDVTLDGSVVTPPAVPADPTSNAPQCSNPGVTLFATGTPPAGETWYWQTSATGTSTANSASTYIVTTAGTYYIRARNNTTLAWSDGAGSVAVTMSPNVSAPVFALGASSFRCLGAGSSTYTATADNSVSITYSLDALSLLGGNTINAATGTVTFSALWVGSTTITATATGCNGPRTATHIVSINTAVSTPNFSIGSTSSRCQGAGTVTYTAVAANTSGITYSLDAASLAAGNTINSATGAVTYVASWYGTTIITASAAGCNGPKTNTHTVTINQPVDVPVFALGASSTRCQGATLASYTATANGASGITYSLDAASVAAGNSINASTGNVAFVAGWTGTSTITATAAGCNGPTTATHTVVTNPTVGAASFTSGATSTRCQGAGTQTYTANAPNNTGITYSLDAASVAAGNSINVSTGVVTYAAGWAGTSTITASAAGCGGPSTATHTVTTTATVGTPAFALGSSSSRMQGAGSVTYIAAAANTTGITYSLDVASLAAGNTINATTGVVTYTSSWNGISVITASAAGCGGPKTATHTVNTNSNIVYKQLYLSDPSQSLDRVDPVNTADATTASTTLLSTAGTTSTTFTMAPALCDSLVIKNNTITVRTYITISSGSMPANPNITAVLRHGATTIINLTNPTYSGGMLTWTGTPAADLTVPAGQAISLQITTAQAGVTFRIDFDSQTKPSRIDIPVSTYIDVLSLGVYTAPYPGGLLVTSSVPGATRYIRATVTDPFGSADITALNVTITPTGSTVAATSVATVGCTRTYEYVWTTPGSGTYAISATAKEGYENAVTNTMNSSFSICNACAPVAMNDSISGAGGNPIVVDILANDYDPNNNLNPASLTITGHPRNGSAYITNNTIIYLPNGTYSGKDTITYQVCDLSSPAPLCATAQVFLTIDPLIVDICADASKTHTYYIPYSENEAYDALLASSSDAMPSNTLRTVISIKIPYPGMTIVWDEWEDGYEANALNPIQATTKVWGDGNPYNGIAPGYPSDLIPASGNIVLDNTMNANPRSAASIFYDGKDKVTSNGQLAITQVTGEPTRMPVQAIKTNVTSVYDFGQSFTIPLGEDFNSRDFRYTSLFIRASENSTVVSIDKDNNGTLETSVTLNEGQVYLVNGGVRTGATVTSTKPVGVELNAGGVDLYSIRNAPIYPATWYSNTYYTPVPTSDNPGDSPKDSSAVMLYNSLNRPIAINWYSGAPASGVINVPAKSAVRFPLAYSTTATYKFVNLTGESFTAIEMIDSYTPGSGGNDGSTYDWSFNLISEQRLTDYTTVAWAPGGLDLAGPAGPDVNGNPIWVTPTANTIIYVKYDGNVNGTSGFVSPCGLRYDVSYNVNALNYIKIRDNSDNDQSGIAIFTCNGAKLAAAYGEDPQGSTTGFGIAYWDVGTTLQPFCKEKLIVASDDFASTLVSQPVTITILDNDFGFLATIDPGSVSTLGLLQPSHGTVSINPDGSVLYIPNPGYAGQDTFQYRVCSTPSPIVCDIATVIVKISTCPSNGNQNVLSGQVFVDRDRDGINDDGGIGLEGVKVYLYTDGDCNGAINANELTDSVTVDESGFYQFVKYPEKTTEDNFDNGADASSCANGSDGDSPWAADWTDSNDPSNGFCNNGQSAANTDAEIIRDGAFGFALRLKDNNVSAQRRINLNGATKAFLTFSYRRKSALATDESVAVQVSTNGTSFTTIYTINGNGSADAGYTTVYNQEITSWAATNTTIRFLTDNDMEDSDTVYIDNVTIKFLKYPQCYIAAIASVPAFYQMTTPTMKTMTITAGGSCTSNFDFGMAKNNITVSGTLRNDKNALIDNNVNGPAIGAPNGAVVYAYLVNTSDQVVLKTVVNASTGAYSFPLAEVNSEYRLVISTNNVALGADAPSSCNLAGVWVSVGDAYGSNNAAGSGVESGTPNAAVPVTTGTVNVVNVDIGIQRLPESDSYFSSVNSPRLNDVITLNGGMNPPVLSGSDPEDCSSGCVLTANNVVIDQVPVNAELYYNNALVTNGQTISNFNPNLFKVKITAAALGDSIVVFNYSYVDAAQMKDPTPATYTIVWLIPLTADGLNATANLNGNNAVVKWTTQSEQNTSHFVVERSVDNRYFYPIGSDVPAAGSSAEKKDYQMPDDISGLASQYNTIFYRVKLVDFDGKIQYSNVAVVRLTEKVEVAAWPNPFQSNVTISITAEKATTYHIRMVDVTGKLIRQTTHAVSKGTTQIAVSQLDKLSSGIYLLEITDEKSAVKTVQRLVKN